MAKCLNIDLFYINGKNIVHKVRGIFEDGAGVGNTAAANLCNFYRSRPLSLFLVWINLRHRHRPLTLGHMPTVDVRG